MFAFALWDDDKQRLFLARDRLGIKPLYYTESIGKFLFASEIKSILQNPAIQRKINPRAICEYMLFGFLTSNEQPLAGIHMLLPGYYALYQRGKGLTIHQYWDPAQISPTHFTLEEAAEKLRNILNKAVISHMIADVEVGLTLSGGIDSSTVLTFMAQALGEKSSSITAFTTGYGLSTDEFPAARKAAQRFNVMTQEHLISFEQIIETLPQIIWHVEEPLPHVGNFTTYSWSSIISEKIKVVQIGEGADELLGGYAHYRLFDFPWSLTPTSMKRRLFRLGYQMPSVAEVTHLLNPELCPASLVHHVYQTDYLDKVKLYSDIYQGFLLHEIQNELPNSQLLRVDKLMMAHSVEARVPFLDHHVVELALSLDNNFKRKAGLEKYILRKAMERDLPPETIFRSKYGKTGTQPITQGLMKRGLEKIIQVALQQKQINTYSIFTSHIEEYIQSPRPVPIFGTRIRDKLLIFILMLEVWARLYIDSSIQFPPEIGLREFLRPS